MSRPLLPLFNEQTAEQKARVAEDAWNRRDPKVVSMPYTPGWRLRIASESLEDREEIRPFLIRKGMRELSYRLIKELWDETRLADHPGLTNLGL